VILTSLQAIKVQTLIRARLDELMQQRSLQEAAAAKASSELSESKRRVTAHQTRIATLEESYKQAM
jgi:predicted  nucleic acid-binding Zn-ribbon protein